MKTMEYWYRCDLYRYHLKRALFNHDITAAAIEVRDKLLSEFKDQPDMVAMAQTGARKSERKRSTPSQQQMNTVRAEVNLRPRAEPARYYSESWDAQNHQWQWSDTNWSQWSSSPSSSTWTRPWRWSTQNWNRYGYDGWACLY